MTQKKIIIDTDPGIDDAMAIYLAFSDPRLEVVGLTSIFGNVYTHQATRNALWLTEQACYPCAVAEGAERPLRQQPNPPSFHVHGDEGFGAYTDIRTSRKPDSRPAHVFMSEMCRENKGEITLCPIGPLTNIAALLAYDPDIVDYVKGLVIMGGALDEPGNVTPYAEANFWNDSHAAEMVVAASWPITMIGLDVTTKIRCRPEDFEELARAAPMMGGFIRDISDFYVDFYETVAKERVCFMHDPTAVLAITEDALFSYETTPISVVCEGERIGETLRSTQAGRPAHKIALKVDHARARSLFLERCAKTDDQRKTRLS